jgi:hypothetical protein
MTAAQTFFDEWLSPVGPLQLIAADTMAALQGSESRTRRRNAHAVGNLKICVGAILANLARAAIAYVPPVAVAIPLGNRRKASTRYDRKGLRQLAGTIQRLERAGLLVLEKSKRRGHVSTITASAKLLALLEASDIRPAHIGRAEGEELIIVNRTTRGFVSRLEDGEEVVRYGKATHRVDYVREVTALRRTREDLKALNRFLQAAGLQFLGDDPTIDTSQRTLKRVLSLPGDVHVHSFKFNTGGRLFGGWWQRVPRDQRHLIRINAEPVAEVDYSQLFPRLACLKAGVTLPLGDVYAVPGFEPYRAGIKKVVNALIFASKPMVRLPKDISNDELPADLKLHDIRSILLAHQPLLAAGFEKGLGLGLMFLESTILLVVLKRLMTQRVIALPLHDAVIVPVSKIPEATKAMASSALEVVGTELPLKVKEWTMENS